MVGVHDPRRGGEDLHLRETGEALAVALDGAGPLALTVLEVGELGAEECSLQLVEALVGADHLVDVLRTFAVGAEHRDPVGDRRIVSRDRACFPECAQVLARIEAEGRPVAERARRFAVECRPEGLRVCPRTAGSRPAR